jgi:agmatinase
VRQQVERERLDLPFTGIPTFFRTRLVDNLTSVDADVAILGIPNDEGSWWLPGERFAPRKLREMSLRFVGGPSSAAGFWDIDEDRAYLEYELRNGRIVDAGDVDVIITRPDATWENVTRDVGALIASGALPVILGGDHSNTYPVVRAFSDEITVVHFDAHMDYQPFIHGVVHSWGNPMRLVTALDHVRRVIQVGIRSFRTQRQDVQDSLAAGNDVITVRKLRTDGPARLLDQIPEGGRVYVSIDMDVLDLPLVPGVSAPEPDGLTYAELRDLLFGIAAKSRVVGFDVVEVNPLLDNPTSQTAFLAVQVIAEFLGRIVEHPDHRAAHPTQPAQ